MEKKEKLRLYLQSINWNHVQLSNTRLETILTAACLRFLAGLSELDFLLELSEEISKRENKEMTYYFITLLDTLHDLRIKLEWKEILPTDMRFLDHIINKTQKKLTNIHVGDYFNRD